MGYGLSVDFEVVEFLNSTPRRLRTRLFGHLIKLRLAPDWYIDYQETSPAGRSLEVRLFAGYSFHYWIDAADKQVKVLDVRPADK